MGVKLEKVGKRRFKVLEEFRREVYVDDLYLSIVVPVGFDTDLASLPKLAMAIFGKLGHWDEAAICHDYLYRKAICRNRNLFIPIKRRTADKFFHQAMLDDNVKPLYAHCFYCYCCLFGWWPWRRYRKAEGG